jgi:large subunit ribosomal protein L10
MRPEKQFLLDGIRDKINQSKGFILTRYNRMNPNVASEFRLSLAETGGDYEVVKKTILIKAAQEAGCALDSVVLDGHIGIIFADSDMLQTTKAVYKFRQTNEETLDVLGGLFEGQIYSSKDVEALSKLPSKDEMRAQLLATLEAVPAQTLAVFEALLSSTIYCLDNKSKS